MTDRAILISIAPRYLEMIAAGTKTVELRRRFPDVSSQTRLYLYCTLPVGAVVGRARIDSVLRMAPETLWERHAADTGVTRAEFSAYFEGRDLACGVVLSEYEPVPACSLAQLRELLGPGAAPQSYRYLAPCVERALAGQLSRHRVAASRSMPTARLDSSEARPAVGGYSAVGAPAAE